MWVWVTFAYLIPALAIAMQILSPPNQRSHKPEQLAWRNLAAQPRNGSEVEILDVARESIRMLRELR